MNPTEQEQQLRDSLTHHADRVSGHPFGLAEVKQQARGIRRRRQGLSVLAAAAVLAVAVPTGLSLGGSLDSGQEIQRPATTNSVSPSPAPSPAPTPRADGTFPLTVHGLPTGDAAGVPYLEGGRLVTPSGPVRLPEPYGMVTPYDGGYLAVLSSQHPGQVVVLNAAMEVIHTYPDGGFSLAVSQDGSRVAYVVRESKTKVRLVDAPTDGTDAVTWTIDVPRGESLEPVGFLDDDTVVYNSPAADVMGYARAGDKPTPITGLLRVDDASEATGLVSGLVSYGNDGGCSGVMDPATGELLWKSCEVSKLRFSPDGRYVVADASYFDGAGSPTLTVLDASTGGVVVTFSPESGTRTVVGVSQAVWEDDSTVLAYLAEGNDQTMVRLGLNGSIERVTEVFTVKGMVVNVWFSEHRR